MVRAVLALRRKVPACGSAEPAKHVSRITGAAGRGHRSPEFCSGSSVMRDQDEVNGMDGVEVEMLGASPTVPWPLSGPMADVAVGIVALSARSGRPHRGNGCAIAALKGRGPAVRRSRRRGVGQRTSYAQPDFSRIQRSAWGNRRTSAANTARSAQSVRGRGLVRRSTATSWRSTRSSTSFAAEVRPSSRTSQTTCRKIK
jgi:hypothetical protein